MGWRKLIPCIPMATPMAEVTPPREEVHPFSADRPIHQRSDDKLGREAFSESISKAVEGWDGDDSLVIALYGEWGSGKTSVKNMVVESLTAVKAEDRPQIVEFSPWAFAGQEHLMEGFFDEIGKVLGRFATTDDERKLVSKWKRYAAALNVGKSIAESMHSSVTVGLTLLLGLSAGAVAAHFTGESAVWTVVVLFLVMAGLRASASFADAIVNYFASRAERAKLTLPELKREIAGLLETRKQSILVIIDDVDRLDKEEARLLFQIVKSNADLPRLVYLLLFQRDIVEEKFDDGEKGRGREYLEKLIQVGFDVPAPDQARMMRLLFRGLDDLLGDQAVGERFSQDRWSELYLLGLKPYFISLRDIYRFLSTLRFHVGLLRTGGSFDVNPVDLIALEVLRLYEPELYRKLHSAKETLTDHSTRDKSKREEAIQSAVMEGLVGSVSEDRKESAKHVLKSLFPTIGWVWGESRYSGSDEAWQRDLRVCCREMFDRYFHLAVPEGDLPESDFKQLREAIVDRGRFAAVMRGLNNRGLMSVAAERLEAFKEQLSLDHAESFVTGLLDVADELPPENPGMFMISPAMHVMRVIYWYLKREGDAAKREAVLEKAFVATTGLDVALRKIAIEFDEDRKGSAIHERLIRPESVPKFKQLCIDKIRKAAQDGSLKSASSGEGLRQILYRWKEMGDWDSAKAWVNGMMSSPEDVLVILRAFTMVVKSSGGGHGYREKWGIQLSAVEEFVPLGVLEPASKRIIEEGLSPENERALKAFRTALLRKEQGKPDFGSRVIDDDD